MILKNLRKNKDGSYDFDFSVAEEEAEFLMDFAIQELIRQGVIKIAEEQDMELAFMEPKEGEKLQ